MIEESPIAEINLDLLYAAKKLRYMLSHAIRQRNNESFWEQAVTELKQTQWLEELQ